MNNNGNMRTIIAHSETSRVYCMMSNDRHGIISNSTALIGSMMESFLANTSLGLNVISYSAHCTEYLDLDGNPSIMTP